MFTAEVKGGSLRIRPELIIVTSNYLPSQCFSNEEDVGPILRRFRVIQNLADLPPIPEQLPVVEIGEPLDGEPQAQAPVPLQILVPPAPGEAFQGARSGEVALQVNFGRPEWVEGQQEPLLELEEQVLGLEPSLQLEEQVLELEPSLQLEEPASGPSMELQQDLELGLGQVSREEEEEILPIQDDSRCYQQ